MRNSAAEAWSARAEANRLAAEEERAALIEARKRYLKHELEALEGRGEDGEAVEYEEEVPLTLAERGALIGSLVLSPAGMPGVVVGGTLGGAMGFVTDKIEAARSYVSNAYGERVAVEKQNAEQMAAAHEHLSGLDELGVVSDDEDEAARLTADLLAFLKVPSNRKCADCAAKIGGRHDAWAVVNHGVLVCVKCAAVHRSLGVGVSRVKSMTFDRWDAPMAIAFLALGGNAAARARYLASLPKGYAEPKADTDPEVRGEFIRKKYVRMRWAEPAFKAERVAERAARKRPAAAAKGRGGASRKAVRSQKARAGPMPSLSSEG